MKTTRSWWNCRGRIPAVLCLVATLLLSASCSDDDKDGQQPETCAECAAYENTVALQDSCSLVLSNLLAATDTTAAVDSVLAILRADTRVKTATANAQGICVDYQDGIRGGLIIDYLDDAGDWEYPSAAGDWEYPGAGDWEYPDDAGDWEYPDAAGVFHPTDAGTPTCASPDATISSDGAPGYDIPTSTKTIFVYPINSERPGYADLGQRILAQYAPLFPRVDFEQPVFKPDQSADLACLGSLDTYGVVHLLTHGWKAPTGEVYMLTGQEPTPQTARELWADIESRHIVIGTDNNQRKRYLVDQVWFARENAFSTHGTLLFAQFCYSFAGGWPSALAANVGDGAYLGFDGAANLLWGADCGRHLLMELTRRSAEEPVTVGAWYSSPGLPLEYRGVRLQHNGNNDLVLWKPEDPCEGFPPRAGDRMTYQVVGEPGTFTVVTEAVAELVGGYVVYRTRDTDNPPGLGEYTACDPECGEVEVATDRWDVGDPSHNVRDYFEPPLVNLCVNDREVGTVRTWTGTFGGSPAQEVTEIIAYETVTVPYGTFNDAAKILIRSYGALEDVPLYFWFAGDIPGPLKAQEVESGSTLVLIGYQGPGRAVGAPGEEAGAPRTTRGQGRSVCRLLMERLR